MNLKTLRRTITILHVTLYYRLLHNLPEKHRPLAIKVFLFIFAWYPKANKNNPANNVKHALERLGPIWIKFGQMLSTRKDLLSEEYSAELSKLQDNVEPFATELAIESIKKALKINQLEEVFKSFEQQPIATASIAQVHGAQIELNGQTQEVVVKVIRPNIEKQISADIALMKTAARILQARLKDGKRFRPVEVVNEYEKTIINELDLKLEASNGIQLRQNFIDSNDLYIPHIYEQYCDTNVLVMERINGIPVADLQSLNAQGTNLKLLAEKGVQVFFTQVFRDSFFHADMHPGNIFVSKENPNDPKYIGLDFGIIGTLNESDKRYLAENFVAFFNRDYKKVAELHVQSGWVPSHVNVEQFEMAIRSVCDPIFNKPLSEISFAQVLIGLFDTARQFEMQVQPQLVLLQKTLLYVEGLGRQLYPELDLWQTAKPFLEKWVSEQMGFEAFIKKVKSNAPYWLEQAPDMPELIHSSLSQLKKLPELKAELVQEYKQQQKQHRLFLVQLTLLSTNLLALLLILLLANGNGGWHITAGVLSISALLLLKKVLNKLT